LLEEHFLLQVKSANLDDALDPNNERMFTGLVPDSSAKALSKYTEMVDDIIRTHNNKLQQESDVTRVRLKEMVRSVNGFPQLSCMALPSGTTTAKICS
jgi:hypothetical protein